jgi:hypothetical protein
MKFDYMKHRTCRYDGCRIALSYVEISKIKELKNRYYCSHECLENQYKSLGFDGAIHLVHQKFGSLHPVTKKIQEMREELATLRKDTDYDERATKGRIKEEQNFARLLKTSEKCL